MMAYFNQNRRIMIVGSASAQTRELVAKLRDFGMECILTQSATEALLRLHEMNVLYALPGLIVCEANLPDITGTELVSRLRRDTRYLHVPIIIAAANSNACLESNGQNDYSNAKSDGSLESISGKMAMQGGLISNQPHESRAPEHAGGKVDIVVAEDDDISQFVLSQFLETTPWTFQMVGNGRQAVHAYRNCQPKLILMDISMPEMDGREATSAIRAIEQTGSKRIPIIALTAHALHGEREACLASGMDGYMAKPVSFADLRTLIESYLGRTVPNRSAA